ncbi:uncharacterized protein LOC123448313 isoform X2 [Hordeum vulgare subsp. vulgare]|uniref:uncharacterized protein LOC123448313 isoform X2 n=1 Tax=Hordeum vulgare subsp. vulgare TaxID=112509 RepID=UPI001D1A381F|nr:uncharacterized protein LOC123448313 isoform X2 [Hordeum vulgare subsp. vulgare]
MPAGFVSFECKVLPRGSHSGGVTYPDSDAWMKSGVPLCPFWTMGNFASSDASSSVKEAQRASATSCSLPDLISAPPVNCYQVPKGSRRKHWDSESIQDWLETAELVGPRVYSCSHCRNHVCLHDDIIFGRGGNGKSILCRGRGCEETCGSHPIFVKLSLYAIVHLLGHFSVHLHLHKYSVVHM